MSESHWSRACRQNLQEPEGRYQRYFTLYSIVFLIAVCGVYYCFWKNGKSFIWGNESTGDGLRQHYAAFVYFGRWGRKILYNLFVAHRLVIPTWDFSIGYGSDILTTLHYYVIGDPLNLVSLATPVVAAEYVFSALVLVRLYLAGCFFSCFCFRFRTQRAGTLCAAISYAFCGFAIYAGIRHPYFINPMIYLPLLLLGTERVLHREKPGLYIAAVLIAAVSNFYFFYLLVIFTVVYAVFRYFMLFPRGRRIREMALATLRLAGYALVGVAMAATILLPVLVAFMGDSRLMSNYAYHLFYEFGYYERLLCTLLTVSSSGYWTYICFTPGVVLAVFLLFCRRGEHRALKVAFLLLSALFLLPVFGRALNGFSYATNRWCFAYSLLSCLILAVVWPELITTTRRERRGMVMFVVVLVTLAMFLPRCRTSNVFMALLLLTAVMLVLFYHVGAPAEEVRLRTSGAVLVITLLSITISAFFTYAQQEGNTVGGYSDLGKAAKSLLQTEDVAVKQAMEDTGDTDFSRYTFCAARMGQMDISSAMLSGLYSTKYYWSLSNENISQYLEELANLEYSTYRYSGVDDRTTLLELASVGYYTIPVTYQQQTVADQYLPYGYLLVGQYSVNEAEVQKVLNVARKEKGSQLSQKEAAQIQKAYGEYYNVYKNPNTLPLGYTYDSWMSRQDYDQLSATEKQEAMLEHVVLDEEVDTVQQEHATLQQQNCPYNISCSSGVSWHNGSFSVTETNASVTLTFDGLTDSETYVSLTGLQYSGVSPLDQYTKQEWNQLSRYNQLQKKFQARYWKESNEYILSFRCGSVAKDLVAHTKQYSWYNNREDYVVNLGYREDSNTKVTIYFSDIGDYTCDSLKVICQPMAQYTNQVEALSEDVMEDTKISANRVTGKLTVGANKLLCLSVPYSDGWTAYVDGKKTPLLRANTMYMALALSTGTHTIELRYTTPGLRAGLLLSAVGILAFCSILCHSNRTKSKGKRTKGKRK